MAGAGRGADRRGNRDAPLPLQLWLERLPRGPMVSLRRHSPPRRRLYAEAERARPRRSLLWLSLAPRTTLGRHDRAHLLPPPRNDLSRLALLAARRQCLADRRDLAELRRARALADLSDAAARLRAACSSGPVRTDQAH